jgi:hypothetical protein
MTPLTISSELGSPGMRRTRRNVGLDDRGDEGDAVRFVTKHLLCG